MRQDFIDPQISELFACHQLDSFDALWELELKAVDQPNTERGGWSSVSYLELEGQGFYLKRQRNHLTRSLQRPLGEPTFAREFRTIEQYRKLGIPALQAAWFGQRRVAGEQRAILVTHALTDWQDLGCWLERWPHVADGERRAILDVCGTLARRLHGAGQMHGCFYPKHIFLRPTAGGFNACLIDLEKTRCLWLGRRDRIKDIEPLMRRTRHVWTPDEQLRLLAAYLDNQDHARVWYDWLQVRMQDKASRP